MQERDRTGSDNTVVYSASSQHEHNNPVTASFYKNTSNAQSQQKLTMGGSGSHSKKDHWAGNQTNHESSNKFMRTTPLKGSNKSGN